MTSIDILFPSILFFMVLFLTCAAMDSCVEQGDAGKEYLLTMYFSTAKQLKNPVDPSAGLTGNTLFFINEQFVNEAAVGRHVENASKNDYFPKFGEILGTYAVAAGMGGEIYASIRN